MLKDRTLAYAVCRGEPELVGPASLTPRETKPLLDIDDMYVLRKHVSVALFYRGRDQDGVHPASVIRRALSEALVHYYPLAGRLREIKGGKLVVDCTGEGVLFVQADADVQLADLEKTGLRPPFRCWDQLLLDVEGPSGVVNTPLMLMQVTRLLCGGFVLALLFCHNMCDGVGITQFLNAVSELARGLPSLTVTPVWSRELIKASSPALAELDDQLPPPSPPPPDMVTRYFNFSASDVARMKNRLPQPLRLTATTFDVLAAFVWRARTAALELPTGEVAPLFIAVNSRGADMLSLSLPAGYYGNAVVSSAAMVDSETVCRGSLSDAVALVRLAKGSVNTDNLPSMVDQMVLLRRQTSFPANFFPVSDARRVGLARVDFGWGEPVYAGPADPFIVGVAFFIAVKDSDGEDAFCVRVRLPPRAMLRFADEVTRSLASDTVMARM